MLEEDELHWTVKIINMMISQRIWANFNGKYDFTSWLNADFRIGSDFNLNSRGFDELETGGAR
jgi:hypothetical protein